jgi:outer membrane protein TolC
LGVWLLFALAVWAGILGFPLDSRAADPPAAGSGAAASAIAGPLDFEGCLRLALRQSPYLTKTAVEIDVRRMNESDSRFDLAPSITFRSYYYVNHPNSSGKPYSLSFQSEPYNPFQAYFTLQAQKMATQMAVMGHLKVISDGIQRLGRLFLELDALRRLAALQADIVKLAQESLSYAENRLALGTGASLEVRLANQELNIAQHEQRRLNIAQDRLKGSILNFIGVKGQRDITLDPRQTRQQVVAGFDPATASLDQAKAKAFELKVAELRQVLQGHNVTLAKVKVLPHLLFTAQTPDPLSLTTQRELYVGFGLEVPVWDGLKRIRNISRQKAIMKQVQAEKEEKELEFEDKWQIAQEDLRGADAARKVSQSQLELARLRERQAEIRYQSGGEPLPVYLDGRRSYLETQKAAALKEMEYDKAVLTVRHLSGDLGSTYVDSKSWQQ